MDELFLQVAVEAAGGAPAVALQEPAGPSRADAAARPRRKTSEEVAYDVVAHFLAMVRAFYTAVAKSIHSPARRRTEDPTALSIGMKAAAASLALVVKGNLELALPAAGEETEVQRLRRRVQHLQRLSDEVTI